MSNLVKPIIQVTAQYKQSPIYAYRGNPFIEAIPRKSTSNLCKSLQNQFELPSDIDDSDDRLDTVKIAVRQMFEPISYHNDLINGIYSAICQGYIERNPNRRYFAQTLTASLDLMEQKIKKNEAYKNTEIIAPVYIELDPVYDYHTDPENLFKYSEEIDYYGFDLFGHSGMGKTTAFNKILHNIPQRINHPELVHSPDLASATQIVWCRLNMPADGSLKSLCRNFVLEMHRLTGDKDIIERHKPNDRRTTENDLKIAMSAISANYFLGLLVIDESQYLCQSRGKNAQEMLNFLNDLVNILGVPIVTIGTYQSREVFNQEFRQIRRGKGQPITDWHPLPYVAMDEEFAIDKSWRNFMKHLLRYQTVKHPVRWDDPEMQAIYERFYFYSQGIIDTAKKLFIAAQHYAIHNNVEKLSVEVLENAWFIYLSDLEKYTKLLRNKRYDELGNLPDYPAETIQYYIKLAEAIENTKRLLAQKKESSQADGKNPTSVKGKRNKLSKESNSKSSSNSKESNELPKLPPDDLRRSLNKSDKSITDSLREDGSIGNLDDYTK